MRLIILLTDETQTSTVTPTPTPTNTPTPDATKEAEEKNVNNDALRIAKIYIGIYDYSYSSLFSQLEYEGFTTEQAEYAASQFD